MADSLSSESPRNSCRYPGLLLLILLGLGVQVQRAAAQQPPDLLESGKPIEREISAEQKHVYRITLTGNQYLHIAVEQKGIDVSLSLIGPNDTQIVDVDSPNGREGLEELKCAFETAGDYRLEIRAVEKGAPAGRYVARIQEFRDAKTEDLKRFRATLDYKEGLKLRDKRTQAALRQAITKFDEAAELLGEIGDRSDQGLNTHEEALTHQLLGEYDTAIQLYQRAIEISDAAGDFKTASTSTSNIGFIYNRRAEYQTALFYFHRSLAIAEEKNLEPYTTLPLGNIAGIYRTLGERELAVEYYSRALAVTRKYNQPNNQHAVLLNLAVALGDAGDYEKALDMQLHDVLPYWAAHPDRQGEVMTLGYIADDYFYLHDYANAVDYFNRAFKLGEETHNHDGMARSFFGLGKTYNRLGDTVKSLENLNKALEYYTYDPNTTSIILLWIGQTERAAGRLSDAGGHMLKAIDLLESVRNRISSQDLRTSFFSRSNRDVYDAYVSLLMEQHRQNPAAGYEKEAFAVSEKARARSLLELLAAARVDIREGVDTKLLEREQSLRKQLGDEATQMSRLLLARAPEDKVSAARSEYAKTEDALLHVEAEIRQASPRYAALTQSQTVSLTEAQALLDKDSALLEYALGKDRSFLWVVTNDSLRVFDLPNRDEIEQQTRNVYELLTARNRTVKFETVGEKQARVAKADADTSAALSSLGRMILAPAAKAIDRKRLLIVPDGALYYVPFAVVPQATATNGKAQPLAFDHEVTNLPSASTLAILRKEFGSRAPAPQTVAVMADPVFSRDDDRFRTIAGRTNSGNPSNISIAKSRGAELMDFSDLTRAIKQVDAEDRPSLSRIPYTRKEADAIASVAGPAPKLALDFAANRTTAVDPSLAQYRIVHFATHSFISSAHPEVSGIVLSLIDEQGKEQNGFLRPGDIYNLKFPAELIVLSGCRTGLGKEIRGEGLVGMTQSFMYAGAARVMVSLWDIHDEATAELMKRFYGGLFGREKLSPAAALRSAQVSMARDRRWSAPYYWAAFTLQGESK